MLRLQCEPNTLCYSTLSYSPLYRIENGQNYKLPWINWSTFNAYKKFLIVIAEPDGEFCNTSISNCGTKTEQEFWPEHHPASYQCTTDCDQTSALCQAHVADSCTTFLRTRYQMDSDACRILVGCCRSSLRRNTKRRRCHSLNVPTNNSKSNSWKKRVRTTLHILHTDAQTAKLKLVLN